MKTPGIKYGRDLDGAPIQPKDGERILKEGEPLPEVHRPWINGSGWQSRTKFLHKHPGANKVAQVFGNYWCYAVPIEEHVPAQATTEEKPTEDVLDVPVVVSEPETTPAKRRSLPRVVNMIEFDDE